MVNTRFVCILPGAGALAAVVAADAGAFAAVAAGKTATEAAATAGWTTLRGAATSGPPPCDARAGAAAVRSQVPRVKAIINGSSTFLMSVSPP